MTRIVCVVTIVVIVGSFAYAEDRETKESVNIRQYYSGKFGFYQPGDGLNNGIMFGLDGVTEFVHYDIFLNGAVDLYYKQTFNVFKNSPDILQQAIVLIPLHVNIGYQFFNADKADSRGYISAGVGYYLYFYNVEYRSGSGGIIGSLTTRTESKNDGNVFATISARILIGKIFIEPRLYLAAKDEGTLSGGYAYTINPTGFAITLGFQY